MLELTTEFDFIAAADSRIGGRSENQDSFGYDDTPLGLVVVVCDGMGGGPSGKTASMLVAKTVVAELKKCSSDTPPINAVEKAIKVAVNTIAEKIVAEPVHAGMGTTLALILINPYSAIVAHIGDSRVYQFRHGRRIFRTTDHSQIYEILKPDTYALEEEARLAPNSNVITRAIGPMPDVKADIAELPYEKGDRFMLCSDGIWGMLPGKELQKIASRTRSVSGAVQSLVLTVDSKGMEEGAHHDNMTVALLETKHNSKLKQKMSTKVRNVLIALSVLCCLSLLANLLQYRSSGAGASKALPIDSVSEKIDRLARQNEQLAKSLEEEKNQRATREKEHKAEMQKIWDKVESGDISGARTDMQANTQRNELIIAIDDLIDLLKKQRDTQDKKECERIAAQTTKAFASIQIKVKSLNLKDKNFEKCVEKSWITNSIAKDTSNSGHKSHINSIIKSLESLRVNVEKIPNK